MKNMAYYNHFFRKKNKKTMYQYILTLPDEVPRHLIWKGATKDAEGSESY